MTHKERTLTKVTVDNLLREYAASVEEVGAFIQGLKGLALLESLKREKVKVGLSKRFSQSRKAGLKEAIIDGQDS